MSRDRSYIESDENILEGFINAFKDIGFIIDQEGRILEIFHSPETIPLLYRDRQDILGEKIEDIFPKEKTQKFLSKIQESINKRGLEIFEYKLNVKDGERWFEARIHPLQQNRGNPKVLWISRDITERKKRQHQLEEERQKYSTLVEQSHDGILVVQDESFVFVNPKMEDITGYSQKELLEMDFEELIHSSSIKKVKNRYRERIEGENPPNRYELKMTSRSGQEKILDLSASRITYNGKPAVLVNLRDITDQKKREKELKTYKKFLETSIDIVTLLDNDGTIKFKSPSIKEILGYKPEELIGESSFDYIHKDDRQKAENQFKKVSENPEYTGTVELRYKHKNGGYRWIETKGIHIEETHFDPSDKPGVLLNSREITEQKQYEQKLKEKSDQLDILNRIVRHDIRNDMNVIDLYLENLIKQHKNNLSQEIKKDIEKIQDRSRHVTELTKISRDVAETIAKDKQELFDVDLKETLEEQIQDTKASYPNAEIELKTDIPDIDVLADEMLSSVFRNILFNAIQHSDKQTPKIEICTKQDKESVTVSFSDNGPGIPDDLKETVFGKGEKSMDSTGTGIGLYLVDTLIKNYSGDVWIEDNKPEGCVFKIKLKKPPV